MIRANNWKKVSVLILVAVIGLTVVAQAEPKNVIFFIGDGMGFEQVKAGNYYLGGSLSFESFPYSGELTTYSANASVTDSAAAATALATGVKVDNGVISMAYPGDHSELETLLERFKDQGKSTGLVTTVYVTHATPAGFGAHEPDRNNYSQIANDYLTQTRPNVIYGGASYMGGAAGAGYTVVTNRAEMLTYYDAAPETMLSGQFDPGDMPYEADYDYDTGTIPRLSEMTDAALSILDNDADGFFLMVEGGNIDHACHDNADKFADEVVEFANAVQEAIDWAAGRTDTLILICADHETGGLTVTGDNGAGNYPSVSWSSTGHTAANVPVYAWGENAELISGVMDNTEMFGVVTATINPEASNPSPADGMTGVDIDADLGWTAGADAESHDVYFGTSTTPAFVQNQLETTYDPGTLASDTTYYWAIDERDSGGGVTPGAVWSFTTAPVPGQANIPNPTDGAANVGVDSDLSWTTGSDTTSHDVYFGINPTPGVAEFQGNQTGATFDPGTMDYVTTYYWRIDEIGPGGVTEGIVWSFITIVVAPGQASSPNPADTATNVAIDADLSWTAGSDATSHDVYFGTESPGTFQGNQVETTFDAGIMANNTTYYWRIDERNAGGTTTGTVWSFTTTPAAPGQASNPSPADTATSVAIDADLGWTAGSDATSHDVYLGTDYHDVISASEISPEFKGNQTETTYEPGTLDEYTTYYWRIDEKNVSGTTTGVVWSFTTAEANYDAYVSQDPIVAFGLVEGGIDGTWTAGDDLFQMITEVPNGQAGMASLEVEYLLHTTASPVEVTELTLYLDATWTAIDGVADPLLTNIMVWNGTSGWEEITNILQNGSFTPASDPQKYIDGNGDIRILFTDTAPIKKEKKDTLTIDLLYAHILAGPVDNPPVVAITSPSDGATFGSGVVISFVGTAMDAEDGDLTSSLVWQSDIDGQIGTGGSFTTTLNDGEHVITASVTDSGSNIGSASIGITVGDPPPAPPTGLAASAGNGQVSLDWDDNTEPDIAGYNVYRSEFSGGPYSQVNGTLLATSDYLDLGVINGTTYYYVVTVVDSATPTPNESDISSEVSATPLSQQTMHVQSITMSLVPAGKNTKAEATILVYDQSQGPVQGATVVGDWYLNDDLIATGTTGITDGTGYALNTSIPVKAKSGETFTFVVTDVILAGYIYSPNDNVETQDSIVVP